MSDSSRSLNQPLSLKHRGIFMLTLILMSTAGLVGSDVYLPALPMIGKILGVNVHAMQLTLAVYLLGLSLGQLLLGPLTDRFGRKSLVMIGMGLYFSASIGCAMSTTYDQMLICRVIQALGASSGLVIGRAMVGDLFEAKQAAKVFSSIFPFVGMSPAISPVIGGYLSFYWGWPATFIFVSLFALLTLLLTFFFMPETLAPDQRKSLHIWGVLSAYPQLFAQKKFIAYAAAPCIAYMAYFSYIAESPFIFHAYGYSEKHIGLFYISLALTYVMGNLLGKKLLNSFALDKTLLMGFGVFSFGGLLLLIAGGFDQSLFLMIIGISILTLGNGFLIPQGTAGVISTFSKSAGYASGLLGFLQLGLASLSASYIQVFSQGSIAKLGICLFSVTLIGSLLFIGLTRFRSFYAETV